MKIVIFSATYGLWNGVRVSIDQIVDYLTDHGHQVLIISPWYGQPVRCEHHQLLPSPLSWLVGKLLGKQERLYSCLGVWQVLHLFKRLNFTPDIIWECTTFAFPMVGEKLMKRLSCKKVVTYHSLVVEDGRIYFGKVGANWMERRSIALTSLADLVIAPTGSVKLALESYGVERGKIAVIPTGIKVAQKPLDRHEVCRRYHLPNADHVLISTGRIVKEKNYRLMIQALACLRKTQPNTVLWLIGPGEHWKAKFWAYVYGVEKQVCCLGPLPHSELISLLSAADIFVAAPVSETQCLTILEAMRARLPVVALYSDISPEIYPDWAAKVVSTGEHTAQRIAVAIKSLLLCPLQARKLAEAGNIHALGFGIDDVGQRTVDLFENLSVFS